VAWSVNRARGSLLRRLLLVLLCGSVAFGEVPDCDSLQKCRDALKSKPKSSLVHFRIGEFEFAQGHSQAAAIEFRAAVSGDREPKWVAVWAHIDLGKVFDLNGERDRALQEYFIAQRLGDNTRGAQDEAAKWINESFNGKTLK
jgi:tetratricopeptide (TPR) repeat protein